MYCTVTDRRRDRVVYEPAPAPVPAPVGQQPALISQPPPPPPPQPVIQYITREVPRKASPVRASSSHGVIAMATDKTLQQENMRLREELQAIRVSHSDDDVSECKVKRLDIVP